MMLGALMALALSACSLPLRSLDGVSLAMRQKQEIELLKKLEAKNFSQSDYVPFYAERGSLQLSANLFDASFASFETAKNWSDRFFTKRLTKNDYEGELFEKAYLHNFQMLAALSNNQFEKAAVVARQLDVLMTERRDNPYLTQCDGFAYGLMAYAFARYQNVEDAQVYQRKQNNCLNQSSDASDSKGLLKSGLMFVLGEGLVGRPELAQLPIPSPYGWVRATYTRYQPRYQPRIGRVVVLWQDANGEQQQQQAMSADLEPVVKASLEERSNSSKLAATAKTALVIAAADKAYEKISGKALKDTKPKEVNEGALFAAQLLVVASNVFEADTRYWQSLPRVWWSAWVPRDAKNIRYRVEDSGGRVLVERPILPIKASSQALVFERWW
jgi:hypothetical protein